MINFATVLKASRPHGASGQITRSAIRQVGFAALVAIAAFASAPAHAGFPVATTATYRGSKQPVLLSQYERKVLELEYTKLIKAVREARAEAAADESLQPLRDALAEARASEGPGSTNTIAAARALSDATETLLYSFEGIEAKIKRLQEVGSLLEYDHRLRREQRASASVGRPLPKRQELEGSADTEPGDGTASGESEASGGKD